MTRKIEFKLSIAAIIVFCAIGLVIANGGIASGFTPHTTPENHKQQDVDQNTVEKLDQA